MLRLKTQISIILLIVLIASLIPSQKSPEAQTRQIISGVSCAVGSIVGGFLADKISSWLSGIIKNHVSLSNWFGLDKVPIVNENTDTKENIGDAIGRCGALVILDTISQGTTAVIRTSGRNGGPAFVRNWRNFQLDAQHRGEDIFRAILGSTNLCPYFSTQLKSIYGALYQPSLTKISTRVGNLDPFTKRANCTMPQGWNINDYILNFAGNGGWDALLRLSQPQNNFFGTFMMARNELNAQRSLEEASDISSVIAGQGFDSRRGTNENDSCWVRGPTGSCIVYKDIITPGSYLQQSASALVQQELAWVTNIDELSDLLGDLTARLLNRLLDLGGQNPESALIGSDFPNEAPPTLYPSQPDPYLPGSPTTPTAPQCSDFIDNDFDGLIDYPQDPGCTDANDNDETDTTSGGGGSCADTGTTFARYTSILTTAETQAVNNDPGGLADRPNTVGNSLAFLNYIISNFIPSGYMATTNVLNGNGNANSGDLIAIWKSGDTTADRFDAITDVGSGNLTVGNALTAQFTGQVPLSSCVNTSGSSSPTPTPTVTPTPPPPVSLTCDQPIHRYYNASVGDHYQPPALDPNALSSGYTYEGVAFNALSSPVSGYTRPLYMCYNGSDHMLSIESNCEGYTVVSAVAQVVINPVANANTAIYRCFNGSNGDHLTITGGSCPSGYSNSGIQGYICD